MKLFILPTLTLCLSSVFASDLENLSRQIAPITCLYGDPNTGCGIAAGSSLYVFTRDRGATWQGPMALERDRLIKGTWSVGGMFYILSMDGSIYCDGARIANRVASCAATDNSLYYQSMGMEIGAFANQGANKAIGHGSIVFAIGNRLVFTHNTKYQVTSLEMTSDLQIVGPSPSGAPYQTGPSFSMALDSSGKQYVLDGNKLRCVGDLRLSIQSQIGPDTNESGLFMALINGSSSPSHYSPRSKDAGPHPRIGSGTAKQFSYLGIQDGKAVYFVSSGSEVSMVSFAK